jgi:hypothetical protein
MVTTKEKYPCPICGVEISAQGVAGHNKSKVHLAALEKQQQEQQTPIRETQQIKPEPTITKDQVVKQEVKQTKVDIVKTTKSKPQQQEIKQDGEYNGLEWD